MVDTERTETWRKCFADVDQDNKGMLTFDQLVIAARLSNQNPKVSDIFEMFPNKVKNNESFNFDDFVYYMTNAPDPVLDLRTAFRTYDTNRDGYIHREELAAILQGDSSINEEEVDELLDEFDVNNDDKLDYEEFTRMLTKKYS